MKIYSRFSTLSARACAVDVSVASADIGGDGAGGGGGSGGGGGGGGGGGCWITRNSCRKNTAFLPVFQTLITVLFATESLQFPVNRCRRCERANVLSANVKPAQ